MKMGRNYEIFAEARSRYCDSPKEFYAFKAGAEWADKNPIKEDEV